MGFPKCFTSLFLWEFIKTKQNKTFYSWKGIENIGFLFFSFFFKFFSLTGTHIIGFVSRNPIKKKKEEEEEEEEEEREISI